MLTGKDDERHLPNNDSPLWQESYYFNGYDPENDLWIVLRLGLEPNRKKCNISVFMAIDGREAYGRTRYDVPIPGGTLATGIDVDGLHISSRELGKEFHLAFADATFGFAFALDWKATMPALNAQPSIEGPNPTSDVHIEQAGQVSGDVRFLGSQWKFKGVGNRDHATGVRDWEKFVRHSMIWPVFNDGTAMSIVRVHITQATTENFTPNDFFPIDFNWYFDGKDVRPLKFISHNAVINEEDRPVSAVFVAEDELGNRYEVSCIRKALCHWPWDGYRFTECAFEFRLPDGRVGYGLLELGWRLGVFSRGELSTIS